MADFSSRSKSWGLQVHIQQEGQSGQQIKQSTNQYPTRRNKRAGHFRSRALSLAQGKSLEVIIAIEPSFKRFSEDGLEIVITSEYSTQCFWMAYAQCKVTGSHVFSHFTVWNSPTDGAAEQKMPLTIPRALPASATCSDEREGYISIWIRRGNLNALRDELPDYEWRPTDPPKATRHIASEEPKIIRTQWFQPLQSEYGHPYVFEFRNTAPARANNVGPAVAIGTSNANVKNDNKQIMTGNPGGYNGALRRQLKVVQNALDSAVGGLKRAAPASDSGSQPKRICLLTPQSSPATGVIIKKEESGKAIVHPKQDEGGMAAILRPRPSFAAQRCSTAPTIEAQPAMASQGAAPGAPAFVQRQQEQNISPEVYSESGTSVCEDLQLGRPFKLGEPISLAETQTWKAYYLTKVIE